MKYLKNLIYLVIVMFVISCATTKDGSMEVKEMSETMVYEGYLMDFYCGDSGKGMDGSDPVNAPWEHTTECLIMCEKGGYGISVQDGAVFKFIPFADQQSQDKAVAFIAQLTQEDDVKVSVEASMVDGKLSVMSIELLN